MSWPAPTPAAPRSTGSRADSKTGRPTGRPASLHLRFTRPSLAVAAGDFGSTVKRFDFVAILAVMRLSGHNAAR